MHHNTIITISSNRTVLRKVIRDQEILATAEAAVAAAMTAPTKTAHLHMLAAGVTQMATIAIISISRNQTTVKTKIYRKGKCISHTV